MEFGWLPWSITRASDVGMSYGALAVLGALTEAIPRLWRPAWVGWWVFAAMALRRRRWSISTDAGHTVAVILGLLVSAQFRGPIHWTPVRFLMLLGSSGFGFLLLAHHWGPMAAASAFGLLGAVAVHQLVRLTRARMAPSAASLVAARPVLTG